MRKFKHTSVTLAKEVDGIIFITLLHTTTNIPFTFILSPVILETLSFINQKDIDAEFEKKELAEKVQKTGFNKNNVLQEVRLDIFHIINTYV